MSGASPANLVYAVALCLALAPVTGVPAQQAAMGEASASQPAVEALAAGRRAKGERNLARAEAYFQDALAAAERGGEVYEAALEELTYHLPLMRVERYVRRGQWQNAEQSLQDLLEQHQSDDEKSQHVVSLIAKLRDRTPAQGGVYARPDGGRRVIEHIERTLERFLAEHHRYPRGYDELNELLPAGRYPLENYDIVHYVGDRRAYGLTLRSKSNPDNLLTVQKTGLVQ